jgi:hypothetical protein
MGKIVQLLEAIMKKKPAKTPQKTPAAKKPQPAPAKKVASAKEAPVKEVAAKEAAVKAAVTKAAVAPKETAKKSKSAKAPKVEKIIAANMTVDLLTIITRKALTRGLCRVIGCVLPATTVGYSRNCYIKYWKQIKKKEEILAAGTLRGYIEEIVDKYPEKIVLAIAHDMADDEGYAHMIRELDLYGGVDELEHELAPVEEEMEAEESIDDIKRDTVTKEDVEEF